MPLPVSNDTSHPTDIEFHNLLQGRWTCKTDDGHEFILVSELETWMRRRDTNMNPNGGILLDRAYTRGGPSNEITWSTLSEQRNSAIVVFALLLKLGYGHLVHIFRRVGVYDRNLGTLGHDSERHLVDELQMAHYTAHESEEIAGKFARQQWAYAPVTFELDLDQNYDSRRIFPFSKKETISEGKGATARLWQVSVKEQFVKSNLREHVKGTKYEDQPHGTCYRFVVKEFSHVYKDSFERESYAFTALASENGRGIIRFLGKYRHGNDTSGTHNILLEWGEQDLDSFFDNHYPPVMAGEVIAFWENLVRVADGLDSVHTLTTKKEYSGHTRVWHGWHADIKPDNILLVGIVFKLADFGFAKFDQKSETLILGGTDTYAAPEIYRQRQRGTRTPVPPKIDIWSFGCVLSVSVTWVLLGSQGLKQYQSVREDAIRRLKKTQTSPGHKSSVSNLIEDAFHNGTDVLADVIHWHNYLRRLVRRSDHISLRVLDLLDQCMLLGDQNRRISSTELRERLADICFLGQRDADELNAKLTPIADSILTSIITFNDEASASLDDRIQKEVLVQDTRIRGSKRAAKSKRYEKIIAGKVAHRQVLETPKSPPAILSNLGVAQDQGRFTESPIEDATRIGSDSGISPLLVSPFSHTVLDAAPVSAQDNETRHMGSATQERPVSELPTVSDSAYTDRRPQEHLPSVQTNIQAAQKSQSPSTTRWHHRSSTTEAPISTLPSKNIQQPLLHSQDSMHSSGTHPFPMSGQTPAGPFPSTNNHIRSDPPQVPTDSCKSELTKLRKEQKGLFSKKDTSLKDFLTNRDLHFVVDNGTSMKPHWSDVQDVIECLTRKVDGLDKDGLDLTFPFREDCNQRNVRKHAWRKSWATLSIALKDAQPGNADDRYTDMAKTLGSIFDEYHKQGGGGKMTLIVLTDGLWKGETQNDETERKIAGFLKSGNMQSVQEDRKVSIEFVSFGNSGLARLQHLDDGLHEKYGVPDVVDHTPSTGSLTKMIRGSFDKYLDGK